MLKKVLLGIALVSGFSFASTSSICEKFAYILDKCQEMGIKYHSDNNICKITAAAVLKASIDTANQYPAYSTQLKQLGKVTAVSCYLICLSPNQWDRDEFIEKCKAELGK